MQRKISIAPGEYYHIYNRGVEKRNIFLDEADRKRFVRLLYLANGEEHLVFRLVQGLPLNEVLIGPRHVAIGAYALMPNHFHILIKEIKEGGTTKFMEKLQTAYSMYFNKKNERVGPLFQGTFKAEHVDRDEHLKYLFAYIHLNPIKLLEPQWKESGIQNKKSAKRFLEKYPFSSYVDHKGEKREENIILSTNEFPEYFSKYKDFEYFIENWLVQG